MISKTSTMGQPRPQLGCCATKKKNKKELRNLYRTKRGLSRTFTRSARGLKHRNGTRSANNSKQRTLAKLVSCTNSSSRYLALCLTALHTLPSPHTAAMPGLCATITQIYVFCFITLCFRTKRLIFLQLHIQC